MHSIIQHNPVRLCQPEGEGEEHGDDRDEEEAEADHGRRIIADLGTPAQGRTAHARGSIRSSQKRFDRSFHRSRSDSHTASQ